MDRNKTTRVQIILCLDGAYVHDRGWTKVKGDGMHLEAFLILFEKKKNDYIYLIYANGFSTVALALRCVVYIFNLIIAIFVFKCDGLL